MQYTLSQYTLNQCTLSQYTLSQYTLRQLLKCLALALNQILVKLIEYLPCLLLLPENYQHPFFSTNYTRHRTFVLSYTRHRAPIASLHPPEIFVEGANCPECST
jgi:hypothetical protein